MKDRDFINHLDEARIVEAIAAAEQKSSGEIRIFISRQRATDALAAARLEFTRLGMERTRQRNGVLLYFAPATQQFAIVGDVGAHEKCGDAFWQAIAADMTRLLRGGQFTEACVEAITRAGDLLAKHFPPDPDDQNELPNRIEGA